VDPYPFKGEQLNCGRETQNTEGRQSTTAILKRRINDSKNHLGVLIWLQEALARGPILTQEQEDLIRERFNLY
jgi:hypothetical protein